MVVLLLASSVAAWLVPIPEAARDETGSSTTPTAETRDPGRAVERTLRSGARKPETIRLEVGDQLALEVVGQEHDLVEIEGLGRLDDLDTASPARFNLIVDEPGSYAVRLTEAGTLIGRIEVSQPAGAPDRPEGPDAADAASPPTTIS
jgi:hypothetical protein